MFEIQVDSVVPQFFFLNLPWKIDYFLSHEKTFHWKILQIPFVNKLIILYS